MLIGFRPEHIELANGQESSAVKFPAKVDVVEYLGNEELIHAQAEGNEIVALLPSDRKVSVGDTGPAGRPDGQAPYLRSRVGEDARQAEAATSEPD